MIISVDIETRGLDARKFICGAVLKENGVKKLFYDKKSMWDYILRLGMAEHKRGKMLNVYAHNHQYDFYGYGDLKDTNIVIYSTAPFIASYKFEGKEIIKFLDSYGIFRMPLKDVGCMIGLEKLETPVEFTEGHRINIKRINELSDYVFRDVEIVMLAIKMLKDRLKDEGIHIKRLYTISQIAVAYFTNFAKKNDRYDKMFYDKTKGWLKRSGFADEIHGAYRGGRVECFDLGLFNNIYSIDVNNLYGYASTKIKFPDLGSEKRIYEPLKLYRKEDLVKTIGISRCMLKNVSNEIGIIPIRTSHGNYFPSKGKIIIGDYTHIEIEEAMKEGYELMDVEWSIVWDEMPNPFSELTPRLYELRGKVDNKFDYWFYKQMQNASYGKLAQRAGTSEIVLDRSDNIEELIDNGYTIVNRVGYNYMLRKENENAMTKSYYAPIIPTLINAYARVFMYRQFKKIPKKDLIYTDTDSIYMRGDYLDKFNINFELGGFKVENRDEEMLLYGRKTYLIGEEVKVSGIRKKGLGITQFKEGKVMNRKMLTIKTARGINEIGSFVDEERDLITQMNDFEEYLEEMDNENVYIDVSLINRMYFIERLRGITH